MVGPIHTTAISGTDSAVKFGKRSRVTPQLGGQTHAKPRTTTPVNTATYDASDIDNREFGILFAFILRQSKTTAAKFDTQASRRLVRRSDSYLSQIAL